MKEQQTSACGVKPTGHLSSTRFLLCMWLLFNSSLLQQQTRHFCSDLNSLTRRGWNNGNHGGDGGLRPRPRSLPSWHWSVWSKVCCLNTGMVNKWWSDGNGEDKHWVDVSGCRWSSELCYWCFYMIYDFDSPTVGLFYSVFPHSGKVH